MKMTKLSPAKLVLARFAGSPTAIANAMKAVGYPCSRSTVASWGRRNSIPGKAAPALLQAAAYAGVCLTAYELLNGGEL